MCVKKRGGRPLLRSVHADPTPASALVVTKTRLSPGEPLAPAYTVFESVGATSLANGATATITVTVNDTTTAGTTLMNRGSASSATPDPNTKNNSMTVKTNVD